MQSALDDIYQKTIGSMAEADFFCFGGVLYSAIVSLTSVSLYWLFERIPGWEWLGDLLVLATLAIAMALIAWTKVRLAKPSFNTGMLASCYMQYKFTHR
jgi:hypothetical protein